MEKIIDLIVEQHGWKIKKITPVHGGDINQSYCIDTDQGKFFIKMNDAGRYPKMFEKEAAGLAALQQHFALKVSDVIATGEVENVQYLMLEWLQPAVATGHSWQAFGQALAQMHKSTNKQFGWYEETYIASIIQKNNWNKNWPEFYAEQRILPLVKTLRDSSVFTNKDVALAEVFCNCLVNAIPDEPPVLLHGDLWSGNVMATSVNNQLTTAIYDPDVFYGHREIDIAMTKLFGGFPAEFYTAYLEVHPLQSEWQQRLPVFQLYPLLVHAVLFGGGYVSKVREIISNE